MVGRANRYCGICSKPSMYFGLAHPGDPDKKSASPAMAAGEAKKE